MRCRGTSSPNTSGHGLNHQFSNLFITKDLATIRHNSFNLSCSSRSVVQQRHCYRTLSLCPSELHQTREGKMIDTSPRIELRKGATTCSPRQSRTLTSDQNDNTSRNADQVCSSFPLQLWFFHWDAIRYKGSSYLRCQFQIKPGAKINAGMHFESVDNSITWTRCLCPSPNLVQKIPVYWILRFAVLIFACFFFQQTHQKSGN